MNILSDVKVALGVAGDEFDGMITDLILAGCKDLKIAGVNAIDTDPLIKRAVITYCRLNFSVFGLPDGYPELKASYDEQKAQLQMASGYTDWGTE